MKCSSVTEELSAYLDGELPEDLASHVQAHVRRCDLCAAEAEEMTRVRDVLRALPAAEPPPYVAERSLRAVIRVSRRRRSAWEAPRWWRRLWARVPPQRRPTVAAAAVAVALALIITPWSLGRHHGRAGAAQTGADWDAMTVNLKEAPRTLWGTAVEAGRGIEEAFHGGEFDRREAQPDDSDDGKGASLHLLPERSRNSAKAESDRPASLTRRLAA